jgi:Icc-related predicted phosphoesterase
MIRIAAVGDVHAGLDSVGAIGPSFGGIDDLADVLLLAGDLTKWGDPDEARVLVDELREISAPIVAVLGNHDHHLDRGAEVRAVLEDAGIAVLEGETAEFTVGAHSLGIAGVKGFGGGFTGACATDFGEIEMKAFVRHTQRIAASLHEAAADLRTDVRVALMHYSPTKETLRGEPPEIYPFLGSYMLAEAVDATGADLILHGHAHRGVEKGMTPGGIAVRNVAQPVIGRPYNVYCLRSDAEDGREIAATAGRPSRRWPAVGHRTWLTDGVREGGTR